MHTVCGEKCRRNVRRQKYRSSAGLCHSCAWIISPAMSGSAGQRASGCAGRPRTDCRACSRVERALDAEAVAVQAALADEHAAVLHPLHHLRRLRPRRLLSFQEIQTETRQSFDPDTRSTLLLAIQDRSSCQQSLLHWWAGHEHVTSASFSSRCRPSSGGACTTPWWRGRARARRRASAPGRARRQ